MTIILQQSDLEELRISSSFLSDVLLDFYFNYLTSLYPSDDILFVSPTISFLVANSGDQEIVRDCLIALELTSKNLIFFPVNNNGTHWSLLVYVRSYNQFLHHDSMKGMNNQEAEKLYLVVKNYVHQKFKRKLDCQRGEPQLCFVTDSPQQSNGYDCGLYVMAIAEVICRWYYEDYGDGDYIKELLEKVNEKVRQNMRASLLELIQQANIGKLRLVSCKIEERSVSKVTGDDDGAGSYFFHSSPFRISRGLLNFTNGMDESLTPSKCVKDRSRDTVVWPLTVEAANYIGILMTLMTQGGWMLLYKLVAITWKTKTLIQLFSYNNRVKAE